MSNSFTPAARQGTVQQGTVQIERLESGIAIIRLGPPEERVVTITQKRMESLTAAIRQFRAQRPPGLIFLGPSPDMFTAGADIGLIREVTDPVRGEELARIGQLLFDEIELLPFPTVAAISGPCVGGGCEMALACSYRVISDSKGSVIGLPEIKLGILPGFGGTQRLPRLVGLPKALDIILAGKTVRASQARKLGLVDAVVPYDRLVATAERLIMGGQPRKRSLPLMDRLLTYTQFGRNFVAKKAAAQVAKETKGFYPAPPAALQSCIYGLNHGVKEGLVHEARELGRLIVTPESKALVKLFFLTEASKAIGRSARKAADQARGVVVGAGIMGAGIAGSLARNGCHVILKDTTDAALKRGMDHIREQLAKAKYMSDQQRSFILDRIEATTADSGNLGSVTIAIEAIYENMEAKQKLFRDLSAIVPAEAILATNTSSLSVSELAAAVDHPERVVGMHFFNPVEKMPLVEIVRGKATSDRTIAIVAALSTKLGKFPIVVSDVPGFLVNRILTPYLNEAAFLLQEGYSIEAIDEAALQFGMPMGPVRLLDEVGLDVASHVLETMVKGYGNRMSAPPLLPRLVQQKRLGRKSGAGFYDFEGKNARPHPQIRSLLGIEAPARSAHDLSPLTDRLILALVNEAVRCLEEGVAGTPGPEAAQQIDLGTVMGTGFPPFRGGVMHYANSIGFGVIHEKLRALQQSVGDRFTPAHGIVTKQ